MLENGIGAEEGRGATIVSESTEAPTCDGDGLKQEFSSEVEEARVKYKVELREVHVGLKRINVDEEVEQLRKKIRLGECSAW